MSDVIKLQLRTATGLNPVCLDYLGESDVVSPEAPSRSLLYAGKTTDGRWEVGSATLELKRTSPPAVRPRVHAVELTRDVVLRSSEVGVSRSRSTPGEPRENCKLTDVPEWAEFVLVVDAAPGLPTAAICDSLVAGVTPPAPATPPTVADDENDDDTVVDPNSPLHQTPTE